MALDWIKRAFQHLSSVVWLLIGTAREAGDHMARGRLPFRASVFFEQTDRAGVGSIPLIVMVSWFLGLTMALLTGYELRPYGQERLVPGLVAVGFTRELGPLMTGIMLAARIGAAFTAELGTMVIGEEVEAIEAMGVGALRFLVAPRLLAVFLLTPCLVVVSDVAALCGGALISKMQLGMSFRYFGHTALDSLFVHDILDGVLKSFLFGLLIGLIACYKGLTIRGGAAGVGEATTTSVVTAIAAVIAFDSLFNLIRF